MKTLLAVISAAVVFLGSACAQDSTARSNSSLDSTVNAKVDSILKYQKKMSVQQDGIYREVVLSKDPLAGKTFGIEFNPAYFIAAASRNYFVFSGGLSLFAIDRNAEIACPIFFQNGTGTNDGSHELTLWNQDVIYRRFLGQHQDGFYIAGGIRYTHIKGESGTTIFGIDLGSSSSPIITTDKLGAMFGIGYRFFSTSGFYWGTSLVYGTYFSADERDIKGAFTDHTKTILDFEILKFGYAF